MMNKNVVFLILIILLLVIPASAQTKQPKTERDYFMLLPADKHFRPECCLRKSTFHYLLEKIGTFANNRAAFRAKFCAKPGS
jgi:hypothetical protein